MIRTERWRNYHNDEKVMREVKSIVKRKSSNKSGKVSEQEVRTTSKLKF